MTREEAEALCARNAAEHPERKTAQWRPQEQPGGDWTVVKIGLAPTPDTTAEQVADERPPTPDDPRTTQMQNTGPHVGPI